MVDMHDAGSSLIASYGYDPKTQELTIAFQKGGAWVYSGVTESEFEGFIGADSKGRYFLTELKPKKEARKI